MKLVSLLEDCRTEARCIATALDATVQLEHGPGESLRITIALPLTDSGVESAYRMLSAARKAVC